MSRGATQQRIVSASSSATTANAVVRSVVTTSSRTCKCTRRRATSPPLSKASGAGRHRGLIDIREPVGPKIGEDPVVEMQPCQFSRWWSDFGRLRGARSQLECKATANHFSDRLSPKTFGGFIQEQSEHGVLPF